MCLIFTLVRDINIPPLAKNELEKSPTNIPEMEEVTLHTLSTKLQEMNRNYPYTVPDWLTIMLTITSTIITIIVIVLSIYTKKSGNCLHGKHLWNNRKNKKTNLNEFELREINKSHSISTSHPLTHRLTANSCHSLAKRQLPILPNTIQDQPDSPLLHHSPKDSADVCNTHPLRVRESPKMKIPATPESVKNFLEDAGLDFCKYDKFKYAQRKIIDPPMTS